MRDRTALATVKPAAQKPRSRRRMERSLARHLKRRGGAAFQAGPLLAKPGDTFGLRSQALRAVQHEEAMTYHLDHLDHGHATHLTAIPHIYIYSNDINNSSHTRKAFTKMRPHFLNINLDYPFIYRVGFLLLVKSGRGHLL